MEYSYSWAIDGIYKVDANKVGHENVGGIMGSQPMLTTTNEIKNLTNNVAVASLAIG